MNKTEKIQGILDRTDKLDYIIHEKHHELAEEHNLTLEQYHLILYINRQQTPRTVGELAVIFRNAQNTMSEKIIRIEEKGLITKIKDERDKRINKVVITPLGVELIQSIRRKAGGEFIINAINTLTIEEIDTYYDVLGKLIDFLNYI